MNTLLKTIEQYLTKDGNYPRYIHNQIKSGVEEFNKSYEKYKKESDRLETWITKMLEGENLWIDEDSRLEAQRALSNMKELNESYFDLVAEQLNTIDIDKYMDFKQLPMKERIELERSIMNSYASICNNERMTKYYINKMDEHLDKMNPVTSSDTEYNFRFYDRHDKYIQAANNNTKPYRKLRNNLKKAIDNMGIPIETTETGWINDYPLYPETYWENREW